MTRITPGYSIQDLRYLSQPVQYYSNDSTASNANLFNKSNAVVPIEQVTQQPNNTIQQPTTVPVTTLDKVEAAKESYSKTVPLGSYFNNRIAPPSIVPSTYPFIPNYNEESESDVTTKQSIQENFQKYKNKNSLFKNLSPTKESMTLQRSSYGGPLDSKFWWGMCGGDKPEQEKNAVEKYCTYGGRSAYNGCICVIVVIICIFLAFIICGSVCGCRCRPQFEGGAKTSFFKGKTSFSTPKFSSYNKLSEQPKPSGSSEETKPEDNKTQTVGASAFDMQKGLSGGLSGGNYIF